METREQECQKLSNDLLVTQEHNNKLKEETQKLKDQLKSTKQQHDILAKDLITKLEGEEEKQVYLENKIQLLTDQNKTLQRMLEETPVEKLKPDFDQSSENKVLLESLKNERVSKQNVVSSLKDALETLEEISKEKESLADELAGERSSLDKLEMFSEEKDRLVNELAAEQKTKQDLLDRIKDLSLQLTQLDSELGHEKSVNKQLQQRVEDLSGELKYANGVKTRLQNSLNEMASVHDKEKGELEEALKEEARNIVDEV